MKKIVVFGAGNIGRSLVGHLFARAGYEVVFVDAINEIVSLLNAEKRYRIEVKDVHPETIWVESVRAVNGNDIDAVTQEVATADILATAVGVGNLQHIYRNIAGGLTRRRRLKKGPIDVIICENVRNASNMLKEGLARLLPKDFPLDSSIGLVETSIGKMVPIVTEKQRREDPLLIYAEAYNKIILDKKGFKNEVPKVEGLEPKDNMSAYVDCKLFVHNLGHAATAYLGYLTDPATVYIWEAIGYDHVGRAVRSAMWESGKALILQYPDEFNHTNIKEQIEDLIRRFNNKALGDTIYRVGRDLLRKLSRNDRLVGALLLTHKHKILAPLTTLSTAAAMFFRAKDEKGKLYPTDRDFAEKIYRRGVDYVVRRVCGLDPVVDKAIVDNIKKAYVDISKAPSNWFSALG